MKTVHLIGICGTAMATVAVLLKQRGVLISGSDKNFYPPMSEVLFDSGIEVVVGYRKENIPDDADLVVIGNSVSRGNPEVEYVLEMGLRYCSLPELVRDIFLWNQHPIVIAGTHGKTTTSFMTAWLLSETGLDPSFLIGGVSKNFNLSGKLGIGKFFVIEGDEYDSAFFDKTAKFLKYLPRTLVVNGIEFDHGDIYGNLQEIRLAFIRLVDLLPRSGRLLLSADDEQSKDLKKYSNCPVETFGFAKDADWHPENVHHGQESTKFDLRRRGEKLGEVELPLVGDFNVRNGLAALAAADHAGSDLQEAIKALRRFAGVKRRLEVRGVVGGVTVYDDFAHHPTAVRETLRGLRSSLNDGRIWAIFEPRSATACRKIFQKDFASSFLYADKVIISEVYRSSLPEDERLSEKQLVADLCDKGADAYHISGVSAIIELVLKDVREDDCVVIMSNGDFGGIHNLLLDRLSEVV